MLLRNIGKISLLEGQDHGARRNLKIVPAKCVFTLKPPPSKGANV